jgi:hypothetical protein
VAFANCYARANRIHLRGSRRGPATSFAVRERPSYVTIPPLLNGCSTLLGRLRLLRIVSRVDVGDGEQPLAMHLHDGWTAGPSWRHEQTFHSHHSANEPSPSDEAPPMQRAAINRLSNDIALPNRSCIVEYRIIVQYRRISWPGAQGRNRISLYLIEITSFFE